MLPHGLDRATRPAGGLVLDQRFDDTPEGAAGADLQNKPMAVHAAARDALRIRGGNEKAHLRQWRKALQESVPLEINANPPQPGFVQRDGR